MYTLKRIESLMIVAALCLTFFGCANDRVEETVPETTIDIEASMQAEKDRVEAEKEAYNQMVGERIVEILQTTPAVHGWALTMAQAINGVFHNYEWSFEAYQGTIWYDATFEGYYSPNPRDLPQMSYPGSITWRINIDTGEVMLVDDPDDISDTFILLALPY